MELKKKIRLLYLFMIVGNFLLLPMTYIKALSELSFPYYWTLIQAIIFIIYCVKLNALKKTSPYFIITRVIFFFLLFYLLSTLYIHYKLS